VSPDKAAADRENPNMDNTGDLLVGTLSVSSAEGVDHELLAVFRDDMLRVERAPADAQRGFPPAPGDQTAVFRAPGPVIAKRLDLMGIDETRVLADLDRALRSSAEPSTDPRSPTTTRTRAPTSARRRRCSAR
jgi:hypothetical protein